MASADPNQLISPQLISPLDTTNAIELYFFAYGPFDVPERSEEFAAQNFTRRRTIERTTGRSTKVQKRYKSKSRNRR
jgi:hypothetical protein